MLRELLKHPVALLLALLLHGLVAVAFLVSFNWFQPATSRGPDKAIPISFTAPPPASPLPRADDAVKTERTPESQVEPEPGVQPSAVRESAAQQAIQTELKRQEDAAKLKAERAAEATRAQAAEAAKAAAAAAAIIAAKEKVAADRKRRAAQEAERKAQAA